MIDVSDLLFDDENDAKFARHRISPEEVQQVLDSTTTESHVIVSVGWSGAASADSPSDRPSAS